MSFAIEELAAAIQVVEASYDAWRTGRLCDELPELRQALALLIDASGGMQWIDKHPYIHECMAAPMRAGEFSSFDWDTHYSEMDLPYKELFIVLRPGHGEKLVKSVKALYF